MSKIVGATKKWLRKRLELEKEGQIINPTLHLLHVSVTLRSLDQKKWETKEERDRGKLAADFYLCSARFDLQADEGVSCEFETLFIVMYCGTMSSCDAIVVQCTIVMQL